GILILMFFWDVQFGILFLFFMPALLLFMRQFMRKLTPIHRKSRKAHGILTASIRDTFDGIREIKIYGQEAQMFSQFDKWNQEYLDTVVQSSIIRAKWIPMMPYLLSLLSVFFLMIGGLLYINGEITLGLIVGVTTYFGLITRPLRELLPGIHGFNHSKAATERMLEIFNIERSIKDTPNACQLRNIKGKIDYVNVSFSYFEGTQILYNIDLKIKPGEMVAFVGPSGVGKTTLLSLITRFYEVDNGNILIDDIDIKDCTLKSLRQQIGTLMQNTFLFDGSIADNIRFGNPGATMDQLEKAAETAQIADFIHSLPKKYNSLIGERGIKLSGGQAQRLCLARVLVTDPKILILDEPTAEVDAITDSKLISAVRNLMKNKTTLVIAHRLWTIKNADRIVVMKDGRIVAIGSHNELINTRKFYQEFFASQFKDNTSKDEGEKI
ncbi:MAG: ATP-binding cassette domain-containing protein, partial [Candidatus Lokiarchaeota archaeon]|nr:ATP-binding cassette domain-containing protein [Candidatus Lokiarchaeota archaeon]